MSLLATVRGLVTTAPNCFTCAHFCDDPARIEAEMPGLHILSSAHASVRAQDGLCLHHDILINGRRRCASFEPISATVY